MWRPPHKHTLIVPAFPDARRRRVGGGPSSKLHLLEQSAILHFVTQSAKVDRREQMLMAIHLAALRLADERGLDGFTMDELAAEVGVSRRTLFNYVPGKMDAVLGVPEPGQHREALGEFAAGGPTGRFAEDLKHAVLLILDDDGAQPDDMVRFRRLARSEPRFLHALHDRFGALIEEVAPIFRQREGEHFDGERAAVAVRVLLAIFDVALDAFVEDTSRPMSEHFSRTYDALVELLR